jgi:DNA-binding NtrC family response regulator
MSERRGEQGHPGRLLLVCGDRVEAKRLAEWLANGTVYNVTVAHDGRTGWVLSEAGRWAAVVCDADLPDFPGLELLCQSKTLAPAVPTVLLTEHDPASLAVPELSFAVDAVLGRTCARADLMVTLGRLLGPNALHLAEPAPAAPPPRLHARAGFGPARASATLRGFGAPIRWGAALPA